MRQRYSAVSGTALALACASAGPNPAPAALTDRQRVEVPGSHWVTLDFDHAVEVRRDTLPVAASQAWRGLKRAYAAIALPVGVMDERTRSLGNNGVRLRGSLGGERLSTYFSCGGGGAVAATADRYTVRLVIASEVRALRDSLAELRTVLHATAAPEGTAVSAVRCGTTAKLETRIANLTKIESTRQ